MLKMLLFSSIFDIKMAIQKFTNFDKYLLIYLFGCVGSLLLRLGFPLVVASGGYSSLRCVGFSLWWLLLLRSTGSRHAGFSSCGTQAQ